MALPLPRLDDRTFDELVLEGQVLLPRYAPQWTDYNAHDPGITLLELLAWLAETGFYRLDRTPQASVRAFLRLVGAEPRQRSAAETVVGVRLKPPAAIDRVARGSRVESADGAVRFQAVDDTSIVAARLVSTLTGDTSGVIDRSSHLAEAVPFEVFSANESSGQVLYIGFDGALPRTSTPLALYISTGHDEEDRVVRDRLESEYLAARAERSLDIPDWRVHYDVRIVWEYRAGDGLWMALDEVDDTTHALTLSGFVRFKVRANTPHVAGGVDADGQAARFFIRGRVSAGGFNCLPRVQAMLFNAVAVRHAVSTGPRAVSLPGTGQAAQSFAVGDRPLVPGTVRIDMSVRGAVDGPWRETPAWDGVGPFDRAFVVSYERGEIMFGDGRVGRVPPAGAELRAAYDVGGGPAGNVRSGTLARIDGSLHDVVQPFDAWGGADAEGLDEAIGRALVAFAAPVRLVTLEDAEALARAVPGVPVARAHAIADYNPTLTCLPALGSLTVVVVPPCRLPRPEPSEALLCSVARFLDRRRPLTTELHVVGPSYVVVSVTARLHLMPDADASGLSAVARAALDRFLDPLTGGEDGAGWPIGRSVYRTEVLALLNALPGVSHVDELRLTAGDKVDFCGNVAVCGHGLVAPGIHHVTIASGSPCQ